MVDGIIVGAGPNGLVAANLLADAGWHVLVLEEQSQPGGAVRSGELTLPGFVHDMFSAFYPLTVASPVMSALELERHGLEWTRAPLAVAHPRADGSCAVISQDLKETCKAVDSFAPGDGDAWAELQDLWVEVGSDVLQALTTPFPPLLSGSRLLARLGPTRALELLRMMMLPSRRLVEERFGGEGAALLLTGNALHADLTPDSALSAMFGFLLCSLAQTVGFPTPKGGAQSLTDALVRRLEKGGGRVVCGERVTSIVTRGGRAEAVRLKDGTVIAARRAILADVGAEQLYRDLLASENLPRRIVAGLRRFQHDNATIKVDWALDGPIPWVNREVGRAGTVHIADSMDALSEVSVQLVQGLVPSRPYLVLGQMNVADPTRSPEGTQTAWGYTHVPQRTRGDVKGEITGGWNDKDLAIMVDRIEQEVERMAPGFRDGIIGRHVLGPHELEAWNRNLVNGALNGGTAQLHQQLVFRPVPGWGRPETPIKHLYLASASAHPGGGVHGACGANAARAALNGRRLQWSLYGAAGAGVIQAGRSLRRHS